jgi:hypothetical protein
MYDSILGCLTVFDDQSDFHDGCIPMEREGVVAVFVANVPA